MNIIEGDDTASLELLFGQAELFYIRTDETKSLPVPIAGTVSDRRSIATKWRPR